MNTIH